MVSRRTLSWPIGGCVCGYVSAAEPSGCVHQELHSVASKGPFTLTAICSSRTNRRISFAMRVGRYNTFHDLVTFMQISNDVTKRSVLIGVPKCYLTI